MMPPATEGRNPVSAGVGFIPRLKIAQFNVYMWARCLTLPLWPMETSRAGKARKPSLQLSSYWASLLSDELDLHLLACRSREGRGGTQLITVRKKQTKSARSYTGTPRPFKTTCSHSLVPSCNCLLINFGGVWSVLTKQKWLPTSLMKIRDLN